MGLNELELEFFGYCSSQPRKPVSQLEVLRAMEYLADAEGVGLRLAKTSCSRFSYFPATLRLRPALPDQIRILTTQYGIYGLWGCWGHMVSAFSTVKEKAGACVGSDAPTLPTE